ncbi:MAG: glycosyltransferase family 39 protein [Planctomycetia bacterium]|nr:glycosyltransferase family 39 protein [Planctomycetia bacterium]
MPRPSLHGWIVAAAAAAVLLPQLGSAPLWDDDEPKNAACSLAMLDANDWVVPTFNGRLRIEKPPLVNWVQMAGFTLCGRDETGARIGSALLTIGTCLLTWDIGRRLCGASAGLIGGLAMATCVWTAVGGRAATPDAPLVFCTTLALSLFVRGAAPALREGRPLRLALASAAGIGAACGAAVLAKGPVGLVLPLAAMILFAAWHAAARGDTMPWNAIRGLRPLAIVAAAAAVSAPWHTWVFLRTEGRWLQGFLMVHNVGRFTSTMEGHSGSLLYYPAAIAIGLFPWSIVLAAMLAHGWAILRPVRSPADDDSRRAPVRLIACWAAAWVGAFSCSHTKLPGYVWPAYPALAVATGLFLHDWMRGDAGCVRWCPDPTRSLGVVMRVAWMILGAAGCVIAVGLPLAAARFAPGAEWIGLAGCVPAAAAIVAWRSQSAGRDGLAIASLAACSCLFVALLSSAGAERISRFTGTRPLLQDLGRPAEACSWACFWNVPPSLVFYTGAPVAKLDTAADVRRHLVGHPQARVVVDSRHEPLVAPGIPPGFGVLRRTPTLADHEFVLIGPLEPAASRLAAVP